ncbi:MAG: SDR family NAD(P)-dependent oxidoreductase [Ornithinimicrobium sp.]
MPGHSLNNAVVAVVGASGALGSRIAAEVSNRGGHLILVGRDEERLQGVDIDGAVRVVADLGDATAGEKVVHAANEQHGRLDGLINAAGVVAFGNLADTDDEVIEELFLTNVIGPLWMLRRAIPALSQSQGFVLNISAIVAEQPMPGMAAYSGSKAALSATDRALIRELRRSKISVYDVRPPHTETGLVDRAIAGQAPKLPDGLTPEQVARAVVDAIEEGRLEVSADDIA